MEALSATAATPHATDAAAAKKHHALTEAAGQFEAMFLQQMLKGAFGGGDDDDATSGDDKVAGADTMQSYGVEAVSRALAAAGGLGLSRQVVTAVEREGSVPGTGS